MAFGQYSNSDRESGRKKFQQQEQPEDNRQPGQSEDDRQEEYTTGTELREDTGGEERAWKACLRKKRWGMEFGQKKILSVEEDGQMEREQSSEDESTQNNVETGEKGDEYFYAGRAG